MSIGPAGGSQGMSAQSDLVAPEQHPSDVYGRSRRIHTAA